MAATASCLVASTVRSVPSVLLSLALETKNSRRTLRRAAHMMRRGGGLLPAGPPYPVGLAKGLAISLRAQQGVIRQPWPEFPRSCNTDVNQPSAKRAQTSDCCGQWKF